MANPDVQEAMDKELALLTPAFRRDPSWVAELLDPEYQEIGSSGRLWTRAAVVAALAGETSADDTPIEASQMMGASVAADLILLTYVTDHAGRRSRRSSLWRKSNGEWRLFFHQGTPSEQ